MNLLATWASRAAAGYPDAAALITADGTLSYRQLLGCAQALARGLEPGTLLVPQTGSAAELALAAHAASLLGRPLLPLGPALSAARRAALRQVSATPPAGIELLIATSGTQGEPKAVMLNGANLAAAVAASQAVLPLKSGDVWLNCLPLYHIGGLAILYRCAGAGAAMLLHEGFDARRVWDDIEARRVTHISLVPAMLARLLDIAHGASPPIALKYALVGGGALSAALARRARAAGWPLCVSYGMSETASQLATLFPVLEDWQPGCVGAPLPGFDIRFVDDNGEVAGQAGIIQVRGAAVMAGYANADGELGRGLTDGWLTTGDMGKIDAGGRLHVLGRHDDMLVSGGVNVHPAEVEAQLLNCPGVADAAVTALPDEIWGDRLVALIAGDAAPERLEAWCREHLAGAMRPRVLRHVSVLPRNALGKLERAKLRQMAQELTNDEP
ncbi:MAG: fatty acid--CoA ligase family protein [Sulfuricella sp.]|nr:fatty acid--CoA ligase family protein [Sulfuricella sp.]